MEAIQTTCVSDVNGLTEACQTNVTNARQTCIADLTQYEEPYFIAIVENEEKIKILGWIIDIEFKNVKIGMPLKISSRMTPDNYPSIIFTSIKNE